MTLQSISQEKSVSQTVSQHSIGESRTTEQMTTVLLKSQGTEFERFTDVATTLMARDYKGFGNQAMNGVIAWK